jgi:hypothetical protein
MPTRTPSIIAAVLTVLVLILFSIVFLFVEVIALNGASERQGTIALGVSLLCQGVGAILAASIAGWLTRFVIIKFNWNTILAVIAAVIAGATTGVVISLLSIFVALPAAGIR